MNNGKSQHGYTFDLIWSWEVANSNTDWKFSLADKCKTHVLIVLILDIKLIKLSKPIKPNKLNMMIMILVPGSLVLLIFRHLIGKRLTAVIQRHSPDWFNLIRCENWFVSILAGKLNCKLCLRQYLWQIRIDLSLMYFGASIYIWSLIDFYCKCSITLVLQCIHYIFYILLSPFCVHSFASCMCPSSNVCRTAALAGDIWPHMDSLVIKTSPQWHQRHSARWLLMVDHSCLIFGKNSSCFNSSILFMLPGPWITTLTPGHLTWISLHTPIQGLHNGNFNMLLQSFYLLPSFVSTFPWMFMLLNPWINTQVPGHHVVHAY